MQATQQATFVSIIIPCYNGSDFITEAIESVLAQTYKNWELIIVDDASTDDSKDIVKKYLTAKRIRLLENKTNLGIARTKNKGIKESRGEFLAFLDQDDIWNGEKLELQARRLKKDTKAGVVCSAMTFMDKHKNETTVFRGFEDKDQKELIKNLYITPINSSSVMMIRRSSLTKVGLFDETLKGWDDFELLMRLGSQFRICYERALLVNKRIHAGGAQHRPDVLAEEDRVFEDLIKMHPFLSEYKDMRNSQLFFNRAIEFIRSGNTGAAREYSKKTLALKTYSVTSWVLYFITLLPPSLGTIAIKIIFSTAGKAKLLTSTRC